MAPPGHMKAVKTTSHQNIGRNLVVASHNVDIVEEGNGDLFFGENLFISGAASPILVST